MNKKIKKLMSLLLVLSAMLFCLPAGMLVKSLAASGKITFSDPGGTVGQEVTVNMKISSSDTSLGNADILLAYDASALEFISGNSVEGGAGSLRAKGVPDGTDLSSIVFSMKFKVIKAAVTKITITSQEVYDHNGQTVSISHVGESTVTASAPQGASSEVELTALEISAGTLNPEFSPAVENYTVSVGADVEELTVQAVPTDGGNVSVAGNSGLQMGENTITVTVTAPDGVTAKSYTISVNKSESGEDAQGTAQGINLASVTKAINILAPEEGVEPPEGFSKTTIVIDGHDVTGWVWASEQDYQYCIFYAENAEGEKNFYRYDLKEKTIQRYFQDPAIDTGISEEDYVKLAEAHNSLLKDYDLRFYLIIGLAVLSALLFVLFIAVLIRKRRQNVYSMMHEELGGSRIPDRVPERRVTVTREERYLLGEEEEEGSGDSGAASAGRAVSGHEVRTLPRTRPEPGTQQTPELPKQPEPDEQEDELDIIDLDL